MRRVGLLAFAALLVGCGGAAASPEPTPVPITGIEWRAVTIGEREPVPGQEPTIVFRPPNRIEGSGGCNSYGGDASFDGTTLEVGEVAMTLIGCDGPVGEIEGAFMQALRGANRLEVRGERLVIGDGDDQLVFEAAGPAAG